MILHIATRADWEAAQARGNYQTASLDSEGFIHCSTPAQVLNTATKFFAGQTDLVLLLIDESKLQPELIYEDGTALGGHTEQFPHLYGALNLDAIVQHFDFGAAADGSFSLPAGLDL